MSEIKYTPGPWELYLNSGCWTIKQKNRKKWVCSCEEENPLEDEANARLIAAAPELLESLKEAWSFIDGMRKPGINLYVPEQKVDKWTGAIAKAEGQCKKYKSLKKG